jgi:acyl carrier protein phosphodiesterase
MKRPAYRTYFVLGTLVLSLTCLCCAVQVLLLVLSCSAPPSDQATLTRQLVERLEAARLAHTSVSALWDQIQAGEWAACSGVPVEAPALFVMRADEQRAYPQLAETASRLNHAIDQTQWAIRTWQGVCEQQEVPPQSLIDGLDHVERARQALDEASASLLSVQGR